LPQRIAGAPRGRGGQLLEQELPERHAFDSFEHERAVDFASRAAFDDERERARGAHAGALEPNADLECFARASPQAEERGQDSLEPAPPVRFENHSRVAAIARARHAIPDPAATHGRHAPPARDARRARTRRPPA
jgi:hypothetical protein